MKRLVLDRLWPMLTAMAILIVGAMVLQEYARRRGNETIRVVIQSERQLPADDDEASAASGDESGPEGSPLSALHAQARKVARRGHPEEAVPLFREALSEHPDSPELLGELGYWLLMAKQPEKALPYLEKADQLGPTAQAAMRLGNARRDLHDDVGAERAFRRAIALRPSFVPAKIALGNALRRRGETAEAIGLLQDATSAGSNEERSRAWVALGWAHLAANHRAEAEKAFDRAIEFSPARAGVRLGIARAWQSTDRDEDEVFALRILTRTAELAPDLPAVWYSLGRARERTGDKPGALEAYDRTLRLAPSHKQARRRTVQLALAARDFARARREAERLVADAPRDAEAHFLAASVADKDGRKDDARRAYRAAIDAAKGHHPEAWLAIGQLEKAAGNPSAARAAYRRALALDPELTPAWLALGKLDESLQQPAAAEKAWHKALAIDPKYAPAWLALGQLHANLARFDDAAGELRRALAVKPGYGAAELALGTTLLRTGRSRDAVAALGALVARDPRSVAGWFNLALALRRDGRPGEARGALAKVAELDASHLQARLELGDLDLAEGRIAEARTVFQEALDLAPGDVTARVHLAQIAARLGDRAACSAAARQLVQEAPADPGVMALPALCSTATGQALR
ncbi:MAG TPA: tetratricopeptide repeat protein [Anaeromyxobacteraceae bacterium]|nr:tetratricopeptide repeat protein [Anaeromyxobacteraceae bacterium]